MTGAAQAATLYTWDRHVGLGLDPDRRLQEVIRFVFQKFRELGSARQVLLWMASENVHFPYPSDGRTLTSFEWRPIRCRNVIAILKNPFYAGVYAYGKSEKRTEIIDGRARKSYGHHKPMGAWEVFIKDHHEGYNQLGRVRAQSGGAGRQCLRQDRRHEVRPRRGALCSPASSVVYGVAVGSTNGPRCVRVHTNSGLAPRNVLRGTG